MWIEAELVFSAYKPIKLEKGMKFFKRNKQELYELEFNNSATESYMEEYGCPVDLSLFEWNPANPYVNQFATSHEIGWIDEGDDSDEIREIMIDDINSILRTNARCQVQCKYIDVGIYVPVFDEEKVIIRLIEENE